MCINLNRMSILIFIFFIFLSVLIKPQTQINPDSALQVILSELEGSGISLSQAQELAKKNSTSIRRAEAGYLAAQGSLRRERGYFDPEFFFNLNYQDLKEPTASFFAGADVLVTEQTTSQTGLRLRLPVGTEIDITLNTLSLKTNSDFAFLNPEYDAFGSVSFRQPLLGGFTSSGRKQLTQAELQNEAAIARFNQEVIAINSVVEREYWNLYSAERDYAVQKLTRDRADAFLKETELRSNAGLVGPNQVASAKTFLAEQELLLIDMKERLDLQSDNLSVLIGVWPEDGYSRFKVIDNPPVNFPVEPIEDMIDNAINNNLELAAAKKDVDALQLLVDAAEWESLPRVAIKGSLISTGLGGNPQQVSFPGVDPITPATSGSFGDALNQIFNRKYPGWSIGLELSLPIGLRPGMGEKDIVEAEALNTEQRFVELTRILEQEVRSAHRELSYGNERLKAATNGVEAAQEQVRIGMIEFQNGRITAFELVRLSEDFAVAQRRYSEALVRTVNAVAKLKQLTSGRFPAQENY